jgi:hypothetical protein
LNVDGADFGRANIMPADIAFREGKGLLLMPTYVSGHEGVANVEAFRVGNIR